MVKPLPIIEGIHSNALRPPTNSQRCFRLFFLLLAFCSLGLLQAQAQTTVTIGTGTNASGANVLFSTSTGGNLWSKSATLYTASEITAAGGTAGTITKIAWNKQGTGEYTAGNASLSIYIKQVSKSDHTNSSLDWTTELGTATLVYSTTTLSFMTGTGWQEFNLQTPFVWDGASNLEVYTAFHHPTTLTAAMTWQYTVVPDMNLARVGSTQLGTETLIAFDNRPNVRFTLTPASACTSPPTPGTVTSSASSVCAGANFTLTLNGFSTGSGQTFQWESSTNGTTWTPIAGATGASVTVNQAVATFYRNSVTCGTSTVSSAPLQVTTIPALSGIYTINGANPTGGTNFQTFAAAINALTCAGISSAVTFNVTNGTYNEQIVIPEISGASATNTITFNGNGATLSASPVTGNRDMIRLFGADYVTINNFNIATTGTGTSDFGWGIHFMNAADHNTISNNTINIGSLSTTESNSVGIIFSNSSTSVTTTGSNNGNNNVISGNTINGAYRGIMMHGLPANPGNNQIINNTIKDFYTTGIEVNGMNGTLVEGNDISRPTRTTVIAFNGITLAGTAQNTIVSKNRIHNTHGNASSLTTAVNGIISSSNDAPGGFENIVKNNLIYDVNNTTGAVVGMSNTGSDGVYYYHNTINLDNPNGTGTARGFYQTTAAANLKLINNIIVVATGGVQANQHAIYLNAPTTVIESNRNDLYVPTGHTGYFSATSRTTLADWQAANVTTPFDMNSVAVNPLFTNMTVGNFQPTNPSLNNIGQPLAAVTDDITGATRNTTNPDPGAYEFTPSALDLGAIALLAPVEKNCYSSTEQVTVAIKNYGISAVDFALTNATISVPVTGPGAPATVSITLTNNTLNGGQPLASGDTLIVPVGTFNMSAPGTYVFNANTAVVTGGTDGNASNDAILPVSITVNALAVGTASASQGNFCAGGSVTLNLTGTTGGDIQWQQSTSATGPFTNIAGANSATYVAAPITQTTYYQAVVSCGTTSFTSNVVNLTTNNVTATGATRCGFGPVTLNATAANGSILWYDQAAGGLPVATGSSYSTTVFNTTTFYAVGSVPGTSSQIGRTRTSTSGASNTNTGIIFNVNSVTRIDSVKIYPIGTGAGTVKIVLKNAAGQRLDSVTVNVTGTTAPGARTNVPLGFEVQPGTGYKLAFDGFTGGITTLTRETSGSAFPYATPQNELVLTASQLTNGVPALTTTYYYFYEWSVTPLCQTARIPVVATVTPADQITVAGSRAICTNSNTTLTASSSNANYTYTWSPATGLNQTTGATVIATPRTTTQYVVIGTDGNCSDVDTVTVTVTPIAAGTAQGFAALCTGDSTWLSLQGSAGNIQWQRYNGTAWVNETASGATTAFYKIIPTQTSMYRAVVSNGTCTPVISDTVNVAVGLPTVVSSTPNTICGGGTVALSATASEGDIIQWFSAATGGTALKTGNTFSPNVTATTTYYAEAGRFKNQGKVGPASNAIGAGAYGNFSNQMVFDALVPLRIDFMTLYSDGPMSFKIFLRDMVDGNKLDSAFVSLPGAGQHRVAVGFEVMPGTNYAIGIPNYSGPGQLYRNTAGTAFPYTLPGVISITGSNFSPATARYYYFYDWSVSTIGCTSARTAVTATVTPAPTVALGPDITQCSSAPVTLNAGNAGATFQWSLNGTAITGATSQTLPVTNSGTYAVTVTNASSCSSSDTIVVTLSTLPAKPTITAGGPTTFCDGDSVMLTGATTTTGVTYQWLVNGNAVTGATTATFNAKAAGNYRVVVANASGCTDTSIVTAIALTPRPATPTITPSGDSGQELTSSAATGNQWYLNGTAITGATAQTYQTTANGNYTVVVTDNTTTCASLPSASVNITNTGIKGAMAGMSVSVYPNPSNGKFNVKLVGYKHDAALELYTLTGQLIVKENVKAGQEVTKLQVKNLAAGTYLLKVVSEKGVQINKLIVE
ncbi:T9SS type A sorting domain-containing protein [Adhaeribacter terreus]|uniref:T9SS type A sorting domain-containing protein n=1 Tax=Adhaeribacter terreus TaxID=529703 RepID=A0ABW0E8B4_9BACT